MKPGFMSSVCPKQTLEELIVTATRFKYEGLEFRTEWGHGHGIELGASPSRLAYARQTLSNHGIVPTCIATSVRFNASDPEEHLPQRETLRRYIGLASELGAPYIRTFSDSLPEEDEAREQVLSLAAESYAAVDEWAQQHDVVVLVETHTNMKGRWARRILDRANAANLGVLWHIGHHLQRGESVDEAYEYLRGAVRHLHFVATEGDPHTTDADNQRTFELLAADGFEGFFSVELIDPHDPEAVLAHHIAKYRQFEAALQGA